MSGDKDIEGHDPADFNDESDMAADVNSPDGNPGDFPEDDFSEGDFAEEEFEEAAADEDFIEEDWEAYDEESFIDDSDGDGLAERKAAFNKLLIGAAVAVVLAGGVYMVMGAKKEENLGQPVMEKVAGTTEVASDQKVEFHSETKVQPKDAFGVTYGKDVSTEDAPVKEEQREGLLNDPQALARLRDREAVESGNFAQPDNNAGSEVDGRLPMPSPIAQGESDTELSMDDAEPMRPRPEPAEGLIPMPERLRGPSDGIGENVSAGLPRAPDVARAANSPVAANDSAPVASPDEEVFGEEMDVDLMQLNAADASDISDVSDDYGQMESARPLAATNDNVSAAPVGADMAALGKKLDSITERLDNIEDNLEQLEEMQGAVEKLESRLAKLEKSPRQVSGQSSPGRPASQKESVSTAAPKPVAKSLAPGWVLKSAQPGKAMVAKMGENDIYSVAVGENLAGIGKVTGIYVENGRWIVQGTSGRITQ